MSETKVIQFQRIAMFSVMRRDWKCNGFIATSRTFHFRVLSDVIFYSMNSHFPNFSIISTSRIEGNCMLFTKFTIKLLTTRASDSTSSRYLVYLCLASIYNLWTLVWFMIFMFSHKRR